MSVIVSVRALRFRYGQSRLIPRIRDSDWALNGIDMSIEGNSTLGIVGETGSGKSTLIRLLCGLLPLETGSATFQGREISDWLDNSPREFRGLNQMVFQSPASSLDPRMRMFQSLAEPVKAIERRSPSQEELATWLANVGLGQEVLRRYPHQLSGGQLQRVAIARALSVRPRVLYADEPTSALDVSVQAQVLNLLIDLQSRLGLTLVLVSHDLAVVSRMCERIVVMKDGEIVEAGRTVDVLRKPKSAYTATLIKAAEAVSLFTTSDNKLTHQSH